MSQMPYNTRVEPVEVYLENIPGFNSIKFHKVPGPVFLDHAIKSHAVRTHRYTLTEMEEALRKATGRVYVYKCMRTYEDVQEDKYTLMWLAVEVPPAQLFSHFDIAAGVVIDSGTMKPMLKADFLLNIEDYKSLASSWGMDELAKQLGEFIIKAIATRDYDGKPELPNECPNSVDSHPTPAQ
jgi:hypothetical protein